MVLHPGRGDEHRERARLSAGRAGDAPLDGALGPSRLLVWRIAALASLFMGLSGFFTGSRCRCSLQRVLAGVASAFLFIAGGLLAARLGSLQPPRSGFLLGLYYGGTGAGIVLSALLVPAVLEAASARPHGWAWAWWGLALACFAGDPGAALAGARVGRLDAAGAPVPRTMADLFHSSAQLARVRAGARGLRDVRRGLHRLHDLRDRLAARTGRGRLGSITLFYALLGLAVIASSRIWAGLLDRFKGGQALAILNALLGVATIAAGAHVRPGRWCWPRAWCSVRCSCRWWHRPPRWCATTCRPRNGPRASALSRSCLRPGRSSGRRSSAGSRMGRVAWRVGLCSPLWRSGWARCLRGGRGRYRFDSCWRRFDARCRPISL